MTRDEQLFSLLKSGRYTVSAEGVVFDGKRLRKTTPDASGHPVVNLQECGTVRVSRLVAIRHLGLPPTGAYQVGHKNGDVCDNIAANLEWVNPKRTSEAAHNAGRVKHPVGAELPGTKLTPDQVNQARLLLREGVSMREVARRLGVTKGAIDGIKYRKSWRHV